MFNSEDLAKYKAFKTVLKKGRFEIAGEAVIVSGMLFTWFDELEKRIESSLHLPSPLSKQEEAVKKQRLKG